MKYYDGCRDSSLKRALTPHMRQALQLLPQAPACLWAGSSAQRPDLGVAEFHWWLLHLALASGLWARVPDLELAAGMALAAEAVGWGGKVGPQAPEAA